MQEMQNNWLWENWCTIFCCLTHPFHTLKRWEMVQLVPTKALSAPRQRQPPYAHAACHDYVLLATSPYLIHLQIELHQLIRCDQSCMTSTCTLVMHQWLKRYILNLEQIPTSLQPKYVHRFVLDNSDRIDCTYILPGCPEESLQKQL